ncbi:MAG: hemolysin family protein [Clostridiales bacterium]|nr:hemolysin family protein [Clostridiales bacterium]
MSHIWIQILPILFCLVLSSCFSAAETAFNSMNRIRMKNLAEKGDGRARLALELDDRYDNLLSTILIGNNIVNIAGTSLMTILFVRMLGEEIGASLSTIVMTVVVLIFGEVTPKSIAKEMPEKTAMFFASFLNVLMRVLTPFNFLFAQWKRLLTALLHTEAEQGITEEEFLTFVEEAKQDGGIDEQEGSLIRNAVEFTETEAMEIATPRIDVSGVAEDADLREVDQVFTDTMFSRLPVYRDSIDHITGIIYQKDFYNHVYHKGGTIRDIIRPALFVAENKKLGQLLKELQKTKMHLAVIVDEFGQTAGIVTMEDILEELVGEIWDEHDEVVEKLEQVSDREFLVEGSASVQKVFHRLGISDRDTEKIDAVTVSGWVMELAGEIPEAGSCYHWKNFEIRVLKMDERRVEKIKIIVDEADDAEQTGAAL